MEILKRNRIICYPLTIFSRSYFSRQMCKLCHSAYFIVHKLAIRSMKLLGLMRSIPRVHMRTLTGGLVLLILQFQIRFVL